MARGNSNDGTKAPASAAGDQELLFDAVVFDLDGTLVATDRFWVDAARAGARRAFDELALPRAMPSAAEWMSIVGLPLAQGFERVFGDLTPAQRARVLAACVEEEERALADGQAQLLPGVRETLEHLHARKVRLGIASNCGAGYLRSMLVDLGLERWIDEARCLDSPGVRSKAGMVADLLASFGTRSAVMVGDRLGDRDAAYENGLPHVHLARGFAPTDELVSADATIQEMGELVPRLLMRTRWIDDALDRLGYARGGDTPRTLGVTGHSGCGKSLFARDAVRRLNARGVPAVLVSLDDFVRMPEADKDLSSTAFVAADKPLEHLAQAFDVDALRTRVLEPHARGEAVDWSHNGTRMVVPSGAVLVLQGLFLLHPLLRPSLARVIHLEASETLCLRRVAGRDARTIPEAVLRVRRLFLPTQRGFDVLIDPHEHADLVLDAENVLGPAG